MLSLFITVAVVQGATGSKPLYPHVAAEINEMARVDQKIRFEAFGVNGKPPTNQKDLFKQMMEIDHRDTERMKWIVHEFGWPRVPMVGAEAENNAWLLVQHADQDHPFQKECLALIEPLARSKEIPGQQFAYLFDRVRTGEKKPQRFGTQGGDISQGLAWIQPVENPAKVDELRKRYGLAPLESYLKQLADMYHLKIAPDWKERLKPGKEVGGRR